MGEYERLIVDWEDFQREIYLRFDSDCVEAVVKKFLTEHQPIGIIIGAFIIHKKKLYKRVHSDSSRNEALPYIIYLLHDTIRLLVKVLQLQCFNILRKVLCQLEGKHKMRWFSIKN